MVVHPHTVCCWLSYCAHEIPDDGRLLFKFVLKIFYGTIVIENADLIPEDGHPWCVNRRILLLHVLTGFLASSPPTTQTPSRMLCMNPLPLKITLLKLSSRLMVTSVPRKVRSASPALATSSL